MTARELLQRLDSTIKIESEIAQSNIMMTPVYDHGKSCEANVVAPFENKVKIYKITVEEIGVYEGL